MSGLDYLLHPDNLTAATYCDTFPCGLGVAEPTTMLTDYVLAIELFVLAALLLRFGSATPNFARYWGVGLAFLGVSFAFGGSEHGFALPLKCDGRDACIASSWVWVVTLVTQTPGLALPVVGTTQLVLGSGKWILASKVYAAVLVVVFTLLAIVGAVSTPLDGFLLGFLIGRPPPRGRTQSLARSMRSRPLTPRATAALAVIIFSVPSVLIVLTLLSLPVCCCRSGPPGKGQVTMLVGWVISMCSLVWQATGIRFHEHFNHNDIFHPIFMVGLAVTYAGLAPQVTAAPSKEAAGNNPFKANGDAAKFPL